LCPDNLSCSGHAGQIAIIIAAIGSYVKGGGDKLSEPGIMELRDCRDYFCESFIVKFKRGDVIIAPCKH